ncbi:MAG: putative 4-hydroxybenzoate polyprenyltransferase [Planctomycetes bacterium]|nr:putative 4-hydroxybenzoate polyprenyltransferase [Planctomycetota bacterium]
MTSIHGAIREAARDIKLHHSVFALPFALLAACIAARTPSGIAWDQFAILLALVCVAMIAARTTAMLANRIADAGIDARNPRTSGRAIPSGRLLLAQAKLMAAASALLFFAACGAFGVLRGNWWPLMLSVPVLAWLVAYPLVKRVSWMCHVWLGLSLAMSAPAAALAVRPEGALQPVMWWLAGMILLWVAGFDVIYALQDVDIDRRDKLHSMPADLGEGRAMMVSRLMHGGAVACLVAAQLSCPALGRPFQIAIALAAGVLLAEHLTVRRWGTTRMALTFFTLNGVVSLMLGGAGILGLWMAAS